MNIIQIIENLYINKSCKWILDLDETEIEPFVIQHWLVMNDSVRVQVRWLDKYVFALPPKMWLSLAWSVLPKFQKAPFVKYIKTKSDEEEFDFILSKVRKHFKLSDNDYNSMKSRLLNEIKNNKVEWFTFYAIEKKYWKQYYLNFDLMKQSNEPKKQKVFLGLNQWGF